VEEMWGKWLDGLCVEDKLKRLKDDLREWNKMEYGNVVMRLYLLREEIEDLDGNCERGALSNEEVNLTKLKFEEL
jgi:hypothetical protein